MILNDPHPQPLPSRGRGAASPGYRRGGSIVSLPLEGRDGAKRQGWGSESFSPALEIVQWPR